MPVVNTSNIFSLHFTFTCTQPDLYSNSGLSMGRIRIGEAWLPHFLILWTIHWLSLNRCKKYHRSIHKTLKRLINKLTSCISTKDVHIIAFTQYLVKLHYICVFQEHHEDHQLCLCCPVHHYPCCRTVCGQSRSLAKPKYLDLRMDSALRIPNSLLFKGLLFFKRLRLRHRGAKGIENHPCQHREPCSERDHEHRPR